MDRRRRHSSRSSMETHSTSHPSPVPRSPLHNGEISTGSSSHSLSPYNYANEPLGSPARLRNSIAGSRSSVTSNAGIGQRTMKRLSATASTLALRSEEDCAKEVGRRMSAITWDRLLDDELDGVPWRRRHLVVLFARRLEERYGGMDAVLELVPQDVLDRFSNLLRRPLFRLTVEAQRLASRFQRCTKHEVLTAIRLVLPTALAEGASNLASRAYSLYGVSMQRYSFSKSARCDVSLPIGRFHRWMLEQEIAPVVTDCASLHVCAAVEHLTEIAFDKTLRDPLEEGVRVSREVLEQRISADPELWALLQPHAYLVPCRPGRTSNVLSVPCTPTSIDAPLLSAKSDITTPTSSSITQRTESSRNPSGVSREPDGAELIRSGRSGSRRSSRASHRRLDAQPLLITTVRTRSELASLVSRALYYLQQGAHPTQHVVLAPSAIDTLFYFMSNARSKQNVATVPQAARSSPFTVDVR